MKCKQVQAALAVAPREWSAAERQQIEAHLPTCVACAAIARDYARQADRLMALPRVSLSMAQQQAILAQALRASQSPWSRRLVNAFGAAAAMLILGVLVAALLWAFNNPTSLSLTATVTSVLAPTMTSTPTPASPTLTSTPRTAAVKATSAMVAITPASIATPIGITSTPALPTGDLTGSPLTGTVVGEMYYPSEYIPAMNLFFQEIGTQRVITIPIAKGQHFYTATLPEGEYHAYAWLLDFGGSGAYTACTTTNACDDHALATITVTAHTVVTGVDVVDWYAPFGAFPLPPGAKRVGTLKGKIEFPHADIPSMIVYARNRETGETFQITTQPGQSTFLFDEIPVGGYYLFAWTKDEQGQPFGGAYTCCGDHGLVVAVIIYHHVTTGMITDWSDQTIVPRP